MIIAKIEDALEDIKAGKMVILVDDEDRENEGDLVLAAEKVTPEGINFMTKYARGLVCLSLTEERANYLNLPPMVSDNTSSFQTAFTISIEARRGVTTGISVADRAKTILTAIDDAAGPHDLNRPGHIFPLRARKGGVLVRTGQTEGSVDLARLAGLKPYGVICEIMNDDGTMARLPELVEIAKKFNLKLVTIKDLIAYRLKEESLIIKGAEVNLPTSHGNFRFIPFKQKSNGLEHMALIKGEWTEDEPVLVRVHSSCITGDIFGSLRCECGDQLHHAMEEIEKEGKGVIVYMNQEGRGIGLMNKIEAYKLQEEGFDTVEANEELGFDADERDYGVGAQILRELGVKKMRLMTNNPVKRIGLEGYGLEVSEIVPIEIEPNPHNEFYMKTKHDRMGHKLQFFKYDKKKGE